MARRAPRREYAADNLDVLTELDRDGRVELVRGAHNRSRDAAASRGTIVHALAQELVGGGDVEVVEDLAGYADGFLRFIDEWDVKPVAVERPIANRRWWYAGTFDLVATLRGDPFLVDIKTGASGIFPEACLQVAAYRAAETMLDDDGAEVPMPETEAGAALWLPGDGTYELHPLASGPDVFHAFLHACYVAQWQKETKANRDAYVGLPLEVDA